MTADARNAIVTGGASGLGRAICVRLARDGWNLLIADLNEDGAKETAHLVEQAGGQASTYRIDVTSIDQWTALRDYLKERWGHLDLLVNNAGVAASGAVGVCPLEDWRWIMDVNLWNPIYGCHTFVDWLKRNPRGAHIVNTASAAAIASAPEMAAYNVTKAGVVSLSETLYSELAGDNVGVTVVCPAFFPTNLLEGGRFQADGHREFAASQFRHSAISAADVADSVVQAIYQKKLYVVVPREAKISWYFKRFAPTRFLKSVGREFNRQLAKHRPARED